MRLTRPCFGTGRPGQYPYYVEAVDQGAEWWTTSDVAAYLRVQVATVTNYRKREQMPPPDMTVGRTHMWRPARIIAWHGTRPRPGVGGRPTGTPTGRDNLAG